MSKKIFTDTEYVANEINKAMSTIDVSQQINSHNQDESAHPALTDQMNVLSDKINWKPNNWKKENTPPNEYIDECGEYTTIKFYNHSSIWNGYNYCIVEVEHRTANTLRQTIKGVYDNDTICYRIGSKNGDSWSDWKTVATTYKTEILSSIMLSGWELIKRQSSDTFTISKTGNMVVCNFVVRNPASRNAWDSVLTLPVGFRPKNFIDYTINDNFKIDIYPSGTIQIKQAYTANTQLCFNLSFEGV